MRLYIAKSGKTETEKLYESSSDRFLYYVSTQYALQHMWTEGTRKKCIFPTSTEISRLCHVFLQPVRKNVGPRLFQLVFFYGKLYSIF